MNSDLDDLMLINGDAEVTRFLPYETWCTLLDAQVWLEKVNKLMAQGSTLQLVCEAIETGRVIGSCLLFHYLPEPGEAEIGYVTGRRFWRQGFTEEALRALICYAFDKKAIRQLRAVVENGNLASASLLAKLGFSEAGRPDRDWQAAQETMRFSLFRHEWQALGS